ncbi:MAG: hypothetical protein DRI61_17630 [Chloroflexi bacterium]|nr:MAG: hypothetical protein DRI61_17630 [Chloroflexota bacterium]
MYPLKIKKGIKGPAWIMVPLSESMVDRAVFNGIMRKILGKEFCETQEEFERVVRIKDRHEDDVVRLLKESQLLVHDPPLKEELERIEQYMYENWKWLE